MAAPRHIHHEDTSDFRTFVVKSGAAVAADAFGLEANRVLLSRQEVRIARLPSGLDGLRIAQVSDVNLPERPITLTCH